MGNCTTPASSPPSLDIPQALAAHEGLVHWVVRRHWLGDLPYAEALHQGRIALGRALHGYDPTRGYAFSTYAVTAIQRAVWRAVKQAQPHPQECLTPHPPCSTPDLDEVAQQTLVYQGLHQLVARLPHRLRHVIVAHYGLQGKAPRPVGPSPRAWGAPASGSPNCTARLCCGWPIPPTP